MIITDAHTHIYPCFNLDSLFESAFANLSRVISADSSGSTKVLFLTDSDKTNSFRYLSELADQFEGKHDQGAWHVEPTGEPTSLKLHHQDYPTSALFIIRGFQCVTREKLEVLGIGIQDAPVEGVSLEKTVSSILSAGGLAILPWGVGKWLGSRKHVVNTFIESAASPLFFAGDNGNRPAFWPEPDPFTTAGIRVLSGSDPLPLGGEEHRVGSFGSIIQANLDEQLPTGSIRDALLDPQTRITPFGKLQPLFQFARQQLRIRLQ